MTPGRGATVVLLAVLSVLAGPVARAQRPAGQPGWIALFTGDLVRWLENENRIDQLCSPDLVRERPDCRAEMLRPRPLLVSLRAAPEATSPPIGQLVILATPGRGLSATYVAASTNTAVAFQPDLVLEDWGYGPYFHQTYLERRGTWFRFPADPFPAGTWLDARDLGGPTVMGLDAGSTYTTPAGSIVVLGIDTDAIRARPEQPADMWCDGERPVPPLAPFTEARIPFTELYGENGHLAIAPKYLKGC